MNRDILLPTLLLLVQLAVPLVNALTCSTTPTYNSTLNPVCGTNDLFVKLPDYTDASSYYECLGNPTPVFNTCPANLIFCYVLQKCTTCDDYIPAPPCENLKSQDSANCVSASDTTTSSRTTRTTSATITTEDNTSSESTSASTASVTSATDLPTPYYPSSTASAATTPTTLAPSTDDDTETTGRTTRTTATTVTDEVTPGIPTVATQSTAGSGIPTPQIDTTVTVNFPTVPSAPPTPIIVTPPIQD